MFEKLPCNDKLIKTSRIYNVPVDKIIQNKALLREYDTVSVVKLASSIRKIGLIEPIILRLPCRALPTDPELEFTEPTNQAALPYREEKQSFGKKITQTMIELKKATQDIKIKDSESKYVLISGGYRLRAYKMLGLEEIPARFALYSPDNEASIQIVGEFFSSCSDIFERARKFVRTCIDMGMNACELAENLGFQQKYAISLFNIAKMSDAEADLASLNKIPLETLAKISKVDSVVARLALIEDAKDGQLSLSELDNRIADIKHGKAKSYTQNRRLFCKDMRIYINTLKKTVKAMEENGFKTRLEINEGGDDVSISINVRSQQDSKANVSRETSAIAVENCSILSDDKPGFVEKSVETVRNSGVSQENDSKVQVFAGFQEDSRESVENLVENVENHVLNEGTAT